MDIGSGLSFIVSPNIKLDVISFHLGLHVIVMNRSGFPNSCTSSCTIVEDFVQDFVQEFGKPNLFITMTCDPIGKETTSNLKFGETINNRPDVTSGVFFLELQELERDLSKTERFSIEDPDDRHTSHCMYRS